MTEIPVVFMRICENLAGGCNADMSPDSSGPGLL